MFLKSVFQTLVLTIKIPTDTDQGVVVAEYPDEKPIWEKRAQWLLRDFISTNKQATTLLQDAFRFANGDSRSDVVVHWCLTPRPGEPPCCDSDEEALCKLLSHVIPIFGKGFPTPLLYRMKHYGPASSFVKIGCCFFNILPRALQAMDDIDGSSEMFTAVETLLGVGSDSGNIQDKDFAHLLADALDMDRNYAAQNGARRKMVAAELAKPSFNQASLLIDAMINPMEFGINFLMGHSKLLHDLCFLGRGHPKQKELQDSCKDKFTQVVSGRLGDRLIGKYIQLLQNGLAETVEMGLDPSPLQLNQSFAMVLVCISDIHRRFKMEFMVPPFTLFSLMDDMPLETFIDCWSQMDAKFKRCKCCVDIELSECLLNTFPDLTAQPSDVQRDAMLEIQNLLSDIATFTPTTSDLVEIRNGQTQWSVSKRGSQNVKGQTSAVETSLLQSAVKQNTWVRDVVGFATMPSKATSSGIAKMVGTKSSNQYTSDPDLICLINFWIV